MAGIKGLKKGDRPKVEMEAEEFISGAQKRTEKVGKPKREKVFERYNFSLTSDISKDIDEISYLPSDFRVNRSDVLKAAILLLKSQSKEEIIEQLRKIK
ncbi:MAG: hypothetical protein ACE5FU_12205 [Nitrospinota bacterium]